MSFGSNGIYVGGKDTFISELSGNWSVKGEVFPQVSCTEMISMISQISQRTSNMRLGVSSETATGTMCCRASQAVRGLCPG